MLEARPPAVVLSALSLTGGFSRMSLLACAQGLAALVDVSSASEPIVGCMPRSATGTVWPSKTVRGF